MTTASPTIADLQSHGVAGAWITCCNAVCPRSAPVSFEVIGLAPETPFPAIARACRFVCSACGSTRVDVSPDWRGHRAAGSRENRALKMGVGNYVIDRGFRAGCSPPVSAPKSRLIETDIPV